ncbi:MAG TPA: hypothetical protein VH437_09060 [Terriglobales bacterium]|jgi:hypothetical protein
MSVINSSKVIRRQHLDAALPLLIERGKVGERRAYDGLANSIPSPGVI